MRSLNRLNEPEILIHKKNEWLQKLKENGKTRPDSSKYRNPNILLQLNTISNSKCYYCESLLKQVPSEVDHHIEVKCDLDKSYEWDNLFLACDNCNNKVPHNVIPIESTLNPFIDSDDEIKRHITFDDEIIRIKDHSVKGDQTIKKYRLSTDLLDHKRIKQLNIFYKVIEEIRKKQIEQNGREMNEDEKEIIRSFKSIDKPYSLMFTVLFEKNNTLI
ncbi:HNH endonuclease [Empedobacter brevis]|uniref:HNH endonuclease n=1 Tax=Empedobacter brevis TaxID=247 RepID=UPI00333E708D